MSVRAHVRLDHVRPSVAALMVAVVFGVSGVVLAIGVDALQNSEPGRGKHGGGDVLVNGLGRGENRL